MQQQTHIKAIYTPDKHDEENGYQPDPENAESVTIVEFVGLSYGNLMAIFVDEKGNLRRGSLHQFSNCVFVTI